MDNDQFPYSGEYDWAGRELIGQGGFAHVYKVKCKTTGDWFAVKQLHMAKFDEDFKMKALHSEIEAMKSCESPYIVKMYKYSIGKTQTYLILQLCEQNLKQYMDRKLLIGQTESLTILTHLTSAYKTLHQNNYLHRDLKPKNILLKQNTFKIADFGFATKYNYNKQKLTECCGTQLYMAPQLLYGKEYTDKCDVWSLGLIMWELVYGCSLYSNRYSEVYRREVVARDPGFPYGSRIGQYTKDFIQRCLQLEQEDRLSWKQLFQHPLLKYKSPGKPILYPQIPIKSQNILSRVQTSSFGKFINAKKLFKSYESNEGINQERFYKFLMELDPQITTYQSRELFLLADSSADGTVHINQFKKLYLEIDYRPMLDAGSRLVDQIVKIAQAKNLTIEQFFNMFDANQSKRIDQSEFKTCIRKIVPRLQDKQIELIWAKLDKDKSKFVDMKQFVDAVMRKMSCQQKVDFKNYQRAVRNVNDLRDFLKQRNITSQQLFNHKKGESTRMTFDQFGTMVRSIKYNITRDEAVEMFRLIDTNNSQSIDIEQLDRVLSSSTLYKIT